MHLEPKGHIYDIQNQLSKTITTPNLSNTVPKDFNLQSGAILPNGPQKGLGNRGSTDGLFEPMQTPGPVPPIWVKIGVKKTVANATWGYTISQNTFPVQGVGGRQWGGPKYNIYNMGVHQNTISQITFLVRTRGRGGAVEQGGGIGGPPTQKKWALKKKNTHGPLRWTTMGL